MAKSAEVMAVAVDPDDQTVAAGCEDGQVRVYNLKRPVEDNIAIRTYDLVDGQYIEPPISSLKWLTHRKKRDQLGEYE